MGKSLKGFKTLNFSNSISKNDFFKLALENSSKFKRLCNFFPVHCLNKHLIQQLDDKKC